MANKPLNFKTRLPTTQPPNGTSLSTVDSLATTFDSFINLQHKLGVGADNPLSASTYGFNPITRNRTQLEWMHRGSWICGLAVDLPADDMTRAGVEYVNEMPPQDSERMDRHVQALNLWAQIADTVRWSRLYGGSVGVILIDGQDPATPLRLDTITPGMFKGLLVLDRWQVEPSLSDLVQQMGPHLGLPAYYTVTSNAPALRGERIHHSRVAFRLVGSPLPYQQSLAENLWGTSIYERMFDRLVAFDSASTGAAQLVYKSYLRTLKVKGLRELVAQGGKPLEGFAAYVNNMRRMQGLEGMTVIDGEDEFTAEAHGAFSGLDDVLVQFGQQLSGALQIPLVRLFGQSPTGLNSTGESDLRNYYDGINQQQERNLAHGVQLLYKLVALNLGIKLPPGFRVDFKSLWELDDGEKATIAGQVVTAVTQAQEAGLISDQIAMKELRQSGRTTGVFTNISDADIAAADDQIGPPPGANLLDGLDTNPLTQGLGGGGAPNPLTGPNNGQQAPTEAPGDPTKQVPARPQGQATIANNGPQGRARLLRPPSGSS